MVTVLQPRWVPERVTNSTWWAVSRAPGEAVSPCSVRAAEMAWAPVSSRVAAVEAAEASETGEPPRLTSRPSSVTADCRPLPKTSTPPIFCVHDRWWVPSTST